MTAFTAWAIDTRSPEGHGYIGRYWTGISPPAHLAGCQTALFKTRRTARQELKLVKHGFPRARVVKVTVRIDERDVIGDLRAYWHERPAGLAEYASHYGNAAWVDAFERAMGVERV